MIVFFFKQKTAYEMRISDWSSDVCSSDLHQHAYDEHQQREEEEQFLPVDCLADGRACERADDAAPRIEKAAAPFDRPGACMLREPRGRVGGNRERARPDRYMRARRSEEHTSELQSLMRTSYALFGLK